jgi:Zn-dependent oligopeptidase
MHAAWLPLEVLELPSTLFEAVSMDAACLQVLCRHSSSGEQLPADLAVRLAAVIRSSHYNPLIMQHTVSSRGGQRVILLVAAAVPCPSLLTK